MGNQKSSNIILEKSHIDKVGRSGNHTENGSNYVSQNREHGLDTLSDSLSSFYRDGYVTRLPESTWFCGSMTRDEASTLLVQSSKGNALVRYGSDNQLVLSYHDIIEKRVVHIKIEKATMQETKTFADESVHHIMYRLKTEPPRKHYSSLYRLLQDFCQDMGRTGRLLSLLSSDFPPFQPPRFIGQYSGPSFQGDPDKNITGNNLSNTCIFKNENEQIPSHYERHLQNTLKHGFPRICTNESGKKQTIQGDVSLPENNGKYDSRFHDIPGTLQAYNPSIHHTPMYLPTNSKFSSFGKNRYMDGKEGMQQAYACNNGEYIPEADTYFQEMSTYYQSENRACGNNVHLQMGKSVHTVASKDFNKNKGLNVNTVKPQQKHKDISGAESFETSKIEYRYIRTPCTSTNVWKAEDENSTRLQLGRTDNILCHTEGCYCRDGNNEKSIQNSRLITQL